MYTPEVLKPNIEPIVILVNTFIPLMPDGKAAKTAKDIMKVLSLVITQDWFIELLCYLLNTFSGDEPNQQEVADVLKFYAEKKQEGALPVSMGVSIT